MLRDKQISLLLFIAMPFGRINVATLFTMPIGRINIPVSSPSCPMVCRRSPSGENTLMLSANQSLMTMLFCPSKQKKNALLTCIPISPLVSRERNFSPERLNTCMQGRHGVKPFQKGLSPSPRPYQKGLSPSPFSKPFLKKGLSPSSSP